MYLPFTEGPRYLSAKTFRWRLGLRPLDLHDWIELGPDADAAIAAKPGVNERHRDTVFHAMPDVHDECSEIASALVDHLSQRWPDRYGDAPLDPDLHPLDAAARLVPEDLVVMVERHGRLVFGAGSVCFPNRWDLRSKIGRTLREVHAPVALLNDQLADPVDHFFERLSPQRSWWRLGWGVLDTDDWYTPTDGTGAPRPLDPDPHQLVLRVERETIRRFPATRAVLFTIRTYTTPITQVAADEALAARLAAALEGLPPDVREYKDVVSTAPALIDFLRAEAVDNSPQILI